MSTQKKLRVGVVGAGAISDIYLKNMITRFTHLEVVSICSHHGASAARKAEQYHIAACSPEAMMTDPGIDMIVNLTPVGAHYDIIRAALEHGKHVYTEKTITDSPASAAELAALAREKNLRLGCAPDTFLGAALQTARRAIDEGMLGEIHSFAVSATRCNDRLLSMFPFLREPGAGFLLDYAVYYVTALVSLLGPAVRAGGLTAAPYPTHTGVLKEKPDYGKTFASPNESQVNAILQLRSGVTGTIHMDADSYNADEAFFSVYGTKGILRLTDPNQFGGQVVFLPATSQSWDPLPPVHLSPVSPWQDNCRGIGPDEMADAILRNRPHRAGAELACHVLDILYAILESGKTDGSLKAIPSVCERPDPYV